MLHHVFGGHAKGKQQRRHRQLAAAVDAHMDNVLGIKFKIQPAAAIGNNAGGKQQLARRMGLAPVVIEEHPRGPMHLADDHTLCTVHDERAVFGHQRHIAHVDVLFLDVQHVAGAGVRINFEHHKAQGRF